MKLQDLNVKQLIALLRKMPQDAQLAILDTRRSDHYADAEPSSEGIYPLDAVMLIGEKDIPDGAKPWVAISFQNTDFVPDGEG